MKNWFKYLFLPLAIIGLVLLSYLYGLKSSFVEKKKSENVEVVIEKIEKVTKLVTTEGTFNELYTYKDYYNWDVGFLRKEALIRVKAKVLVGYDFNDFQITTNKQLKTITINNFPTSAEILAVDHESDYYDLREGMFNSFTKENYNDLNKKTKDFIIDVATNSDLISSANKDREELVEMITFLSESIGYELIITDAPPKKFKD